jgi:hypothetical protein
MGLLNCNKKRMMAEEREEDLKLLAPYCLILLPASSADIPLSVVDRFLNASSFVSVQKFSNGFVAAGVGILFYFVYFFKDLLCSTEWATLFGLPTLQS